MQTTPDQGFMDADPGMAAADPGQGASGPPVADPGTGGGFMDSMEASPDNTDEGAPDVDLSQVQHGASMGGNDSQFPSSDTMLTQDETQVAPEEQKAYDDFVSRSLLFISDTRKPLGKNKQPDQNQKSPADVIIDHLNIKGMPADQAIGRTTAQVCWLIYTNAMHQNVTYPPDVVYHGADEVMSHVYEIGVRSGAIKNPPPPDSPEEQKLLGMAKMYATQFFGNNVLDAGLNDQKGAQQFYMEQMKREADTGAYENWSPSDTMSPDQLSGFMSRAAQGKGALASMRKGAPSSISDFQGRGTPSLVPRGGAPQAPPPDQGAPPPDQGGDTGGAEEAQQ